MITRIFALSILLATGAAHAETATNGTLSIETDSETLSFDIEIADEPQERSRGLMFREELDEDEGMLFVYPDPQIASFWMKNTLIPLDMLFIDTEGRIESIARETTPLSLKSVLSDGQVISVLEIFGGQADVLGIDVGDTVKWTETPDEK